MIHIVALLTVAAIAAVPGVASAAPVPLAQTGLTACFDVQGGIVSCAGTLQDGRFQAGVPLSSPRFSYSAGTVQDKLTGLMWPDTADTSGSLSWEQALLYVAKLNADRFGGHADWRMPNINELETLIYQTEDEHAPSDYLWSEGLFDVPASTASPYPYFWTSTSLVGTEVDTLQAWVANLATGSVSHFRKDVTAYVLPVRGDSSSAAVPVPGTGQTGCFPSMGQGDLCGSQDGTIRAGMSWDRATRFTAAGAVVEDAVTALQWAAEIGVGSAGCGTDTAVPWQDALDRVACLNAASFGGHDDWRLPNRKELLSVAVNGQEGAATYLGQHEFTVPADAPDVWTSTTDRDHPEKAWSVLLDRGGAAVASALKDRSLKFVWPVRGGAVGPADPSVAPLSLVFASVETTHSSPSQEVTLSNGSNAGKSLVINGISVTDTSSFSVEPGGSSPCTSDAPTLAPGGHCTLLVTFHPVSPGDKAAELRFDAAAGASLEPVQLSGRGVDTSLWVAIAENRTHYVTKTATQIISGTVDTGATVAVAIEGRQTKVVTPIKGTWTCTVDRLELGKTTTAYVTASDGSTTTEPIAVTITYQPYLITPEPAVGGAIVPVDPVPAVPGEPVPVAFGGKAIFSIVPALGYHVDKLVVDGRSAGRKTSYTFSKVRSDHAMTAYFARNVYSVTTSAGKGGAITRSMKPLFGDNVEIVITPKEGYMISAVTDSTAVVFDGVNPVGLRSDGSLVYALSGIDRNHKIKALFKKSTIP